MRQPTKARVRLDEQKAASFGPAGRASCRFWLSTSRPRSNFVAARLAETEDRESAAQNAYIPNSGDNVSVIATATNAVIATIPVGSSPAGAAVTPDGTRVYVTNAGSGTVSVIDAATNAVTATVPVVGVPSAWQ